MKPLSPNTNTGRTKAGDDVHHKTRDCPRPLANATAKALKKSSRQVGKKQAYREAL